MSIHYKLFRHLNLYSDGAIFFVIGDDGIIFLYIKKNTIVKRKFFKKIEEVEQDVRKYMLTDKKACTYFVVNHSDSALNIVSIPKISSVGSAKLIKRRLEAEFPEFGMRGGFKIGPTKNKGTHNDYAFAAAKVNDFVHICIDYTFKFCNPSMGYYLSFLELQGPAEKIATHINRENNIENKDWNIFVFNTKTAGFRQIVLYKGRIVFTRLIASYDSDSNDVVVGGIEQDINNTIRYIGRLGYDSASGVNMYAVLSSDLCRSVKLIQKVPLNCLTPNEAAEILGIEWAAQKNDSFFDICMIAYMYKQGKYGSNVSDDFMLSLKMFQSIFNYGYSVLNVCSIILVIVIFYSGFDIYKGKEKASLLMQEKDNLQIRRDSLERDFQYSIDNVSGISNVVDVHKKLDSYRVSPIFHLDKIANIDIEFISISSIDWNHINLEEGKKNKKQKSLKDILEGIKSKYNPEQNLTKIFKDKKRNLINITINLKINNNDDDGLSVFKKYEKLQEELKIIFGEGKVFLSNLPSTIKLGKKGNEIPITVEVLDYVPMEEEYIG